MNRKTNSQRASPGRERKTVDFELVNYDEAEGIFSGYGAVFSNVDSGGDVIESRGRLQKPCPKTRSG